MNIISLTGFMGCGKSSVGRKLSELLSCSFIDLDDYIESCEKRSIPEIFTSDGEPAFRAMELSYLSALLSVSTKEENIVLSLGGGTVTVPECAQLIKEYTTCIYLRTTIDTLVQHLEQEAANRPMLNTTSSHVITAKEEITPANNDTALRARIDELMRQRSSIYESTAHYIIDTDGKTVSEIAGNIIPLL